MLGGTGRTGARIVAEGVAAGHDVICAGRSATSAPAGARALALDVLEPGALDGPLSACDAVITALSIPRRTRSPFAEVLGPSDLHSRSTRALIEAAQRVGLKRVIKLSAHGVGDSAARAGWGFRALVAASALRTAFADHAVADDLLAASALDWTIVRPPVLDEGDPTPAGVVADDALVTWTWTRVRTGDVARWVIGALADPVTFGRVVGLGPVRGA